MITLTGSMSMSEEHTFTREEAKKLVAEIEALGRGANTWQTDIKENVARILREHPRRRKFNITIRWKKNLSNMVASPSVPSV